MSLGSDWLPPFLAACPSLFNPSPDPACPGFHAALIIPSQSKKANGMNEFAVGLVGCLVKFPGLEVFVFTKRGVPDEKLGRVGGISRRAGNWKEGFLVVNNHGFVLVDIRIRMKSIRDFSVYLRIKH